VLNGETGLTLPGGNVAWALGAQYREDGFEREVNDLTNLAITPCADSVVNPAATCNVAVGPFDFQGGSREFDVDADVYGVFTELRLLLTKSLQAQVAFRYEDYGGTTGSTTNPKLALSWQATDWLAFRGSAGSTFRGPTLLATQSPAITTLQFAPLFGAVRPFDNLSNPDLRPEEADSFNVGALITTDKLSASFDYFEIRLEDKILNESGPDVLTAFFGTPRTPVNNCGRAGLRGAAGALHVPERRVLAAESVAHACERDQRTG